MLHYELAKVIQAEREAEIDARHGFTRPRLRHPQHEPATPLPDVERDQVDEPRDGWRRQRPAWRPAGAER